MDVTDFGQIEIFDDYFKDFDKSTILHSPTECIDMKKTYCGMYNNRILPVMIGSKFSHPYDNPLKINGYFIINGLCYSVSSMILKIRNNFTKNSFTLTDGSKIVIKDMFNYIRYYKGSYSKWFLPVNWYEILKITEFKEEMSNHLNMIDSFKTCENSTRLNNIDIMSLTSCLECWLGLVPELEFNFRLITAGELIYDIINRDEDVIKCFTTSNWSVKHILNISCVSELMKHYNIYSDIESIRRATYPAVRESMDLLDRQVKFNEMGKFCPVQSPDGQLCGTVKYLAMGAKLVTKNIKTPELKQGDNLLYLNGKYIDKVSDEVIEYFRNEKADIINRNNYYYISTLKGRIIKSDNIKSFVCDLVPNILHNPPVRSTFVLSMVKQAIQFDDRYTNKINDTKTLINNVGLYDKVFLAIMPWFGYNIEDSLIISSSMAERYLYQKQLIYRSIFKVMKVFVKLGQHVYKHSKLFKVINPNELKVVYIENAIDEGVVTHIEKSDSFIKIVVIKKAVLQVGDKLTSLHGQKGVVSLILPKHKMPYVFKNNQKKYIDIIMNPHAFPTRMTIGQIKEMNYEYNTVFIGNIKIKNKILAGDCLYIALRHLVDTKLQFCNESSFNPVTYQTLEGKRNDGGLRFGQMERDILIALGADNTLREIWLSDLVKIDLCERTGVFYPKCCSIKIEMNQFFVICLSYLRALGYDILLKENKYSIVMFDNSILETTNDKYFGSSNPSELKIYRGITVLPICLRSTILNNLYSRSKINKKRIDRETLKLLSDKNGAFHNYFEGHRLNHCVRSVISPDPTLPLDTVAIPIGVNIGTNYCILNRQPTLNTGSFKLMKIKYKNEKTISFNPLLCKSFNADFDGDEMNLYGIRNPKSIEELDRLLSKEAHDTQDYILYKYLKMKSLDELVYFGVTYSENDLKLMIESGSKGFDFNIKYIFDEIGKVNYQGKDYYIKSNYTMGLTEIEWYIMAMITRNNTASIALNTPISGYLQSVANQLLL